MLCPARVHERMPNFDLCEDLWGCGAAAAAAGARPSLSSNTGAALMTAQHPTMGALASGCRASAGAARAQSQAVGQGTCPWAEDSARVGGGRCPSGSSGAVPQQPVVCPATACYPCTGVLLTADALPCRRCRGSNPESARLAPALAAFVLTRLVVAVCEVTAHLAKLSSPGIWLRQEALDVACPHHGAVLGSTSSLCLCGAHKPDVGKPHALRDATMV